MLELINCPKNVKDWKGKYVVNRYPISNSSFKFPKGTIFKITSEPTINKRLTSKPCKCCGVSGKIVIKAGREAFLSEFDFVNVGDDTF